MQQQLDQLPEDSLIRRALEAGVNPGSEYFAPITILVEGKPQPLSPLARLLGWILIGGLIALFFG